MNLMKIINLWLILLGVIFAILMNTCLPKKVNREKSPVDVAQHNNRTKEGHSKVTKMTGKNNETKTGHLEVTKMTLKNNVTKEELTKDKKKKKIPAERLAQKWNRCFFDILSCSKG